MKTRHFLRIVKGVPLDQFPILLGRESALPGIPIDVAKSHCIPRIDTLFACPDARNRNRTRHHATGICVRREKHHQLVQLFLNELPDADCFLAVSGVQVDVVVIRVARTPINKDYTTEYPVLLEHTRVSSYSTSHRDLDKGLGEISYLSPICSGVGESRWVLLVRGVLVIVEEGWTRWKVLEHLIWALARLDDRWGGLPGSHSTYLGLIVILGWIAVERDGDLMNSSCDDFDESEIGLARAQWSVCKIVKGLLSCQFDVQVVGRSYRFALPMFPFRSLKYSSPRSKPWPHPAHQRRGLCAAGIVDDPCKCVSHEIRGQPQLWAVRRGVGPW